MHQSFRMLLQTHARTHASTCKYKNPASANYQFGAKVNETPEHQASYLSVFVDENKRVGHISVS